MKKFLLKLLAIGFIIYSEYVIIEAILIKLFC